MYITSIAVPIQNSVLTGPYQNSGLRNEIFKLDRVRLDSATICCNTAKKDGPYIDLTTVPIQNLICIELHKKAATQ